MTITQITRAALVDEMVTRRLWWEGRLDNVSFLGRLYDLHDLPSTDSRFSDAEGDIVQHTLANDDWEPEWVFGDERFGLGQDDSLLLRFLEETVHPEVRPDKAAAADLVAMYNSHLVHDGWELVPTSEISGRPIYKARERSSLPSVVPHLNAIVQTTDMATLRQAVSRMENNIDPDPRAAIGAAKELVETICKTILYEIGIESDPDWDLQQLVKKTSVQLRVTPDTIADNAPGATTTRRILGNLANIVQGLAELRNLHGTGHGQALGSISLQPRHARLAVNAASTLSTFLFETHAVRGKQDSV